MTFENPKLFVASGLTSVSQAFGADVAAPFQRCAVWDWSYSPQLLVGWGKLPTASGLGKCTVFVDFEDHLNQVSVGDYGLMPDSRPGAHLRVKDHKYIIKKN